MPRSSSSKEFQREARGLSEIVSALIILLVAVSLGTALLAYSTGALDFLQSQFRRQTNRSTERIQERLTVTTVFSNDTGIYVALFNYGTRDATIDSVLLSTNSSSFSRLDETTEWNVTQLDGSDSNTVTVGDLAWVIIDDVGAGEHQVRVVTERGNTFDATHEVEG